MTPMFLVFQMMQQTSSQTVILWILKVLKQGKKGNLGIMVLLLEKLFGVLLSFDSILNVFMTCLFLCVMMKLFSL